MQYCKHALHFLWIQIIISEDTLKKILICCMHLLGNLTFQPTPVQTISAPAAIVAAVTASTPGLVVRNKLLLCFMISLWKEIFMIYENKTFHLPKTTKHRTMFQLLCRLCVYSCSNKVSHLLGRKYHRGGAGVNLEACLLHLFQNEKIMARLLPKNPYTDTHTGCQTDAPSACI